MKKILSILLMVLLTISTCSCSTNESSNLKNIDEGIIETANNVLEEWGEPESNRSFSVILDNKDIYHININGEELLVKTEKNSKGYIQKTNITECNSTILKIVESSKDKIINYINDSNILKDKEKLIQYINNIPIKMADFSDENVAAEYDLKEDIVFISNNFKEYICEWMLVHEFVHALCQKTNGGVENLRYPYSLFNEVLTDIITSSMNPEIISGYQSKYFNYYQWVYLYLGCVGMEGIQAYFYGYNQILKNITQTELDIFVESIEQIDSIENAVVIASNCINEWELEKMS